jgi:hypothetical protein
MVMVGAVGKKVLQSGAVARSNVRFVGVCCQPIHT